METERREYPIWNKLENNQASQTLFTIHKTLQLMPMGEVLHNNSQQRQHIKFSDWTSIYMQT